MKHHRLVIATHNKGKIREFRRLLSALPADLFSLDQVGVTVTVAETGTTYEENASVKATSYARASGITTIADDSGIEVDALDGAPGVQSAVFTGPGQTDEQRTGRLLELVDHVSDPHRTTRYHAILAVARPGGDCRTFEGVCEGRIIRRPRGEGGFGYDPIFLIPELSKTMAELTGEEKDRISHRGMAARAALPYLQSLLK